MFRSLVLLSLMLTANPLYAQRCSQCQGGQCAAPQPTLQWRAGATKDELALYLGNEQIGGLYLPTNVYRPFKEGKYGDVAAPPIAAPKAKRQGLLGRVAALLDVNQQRHARGLPPYTEDPALTAAAERCAEFRAQHRMAGHTQNDFAFLQGASASSAGCAAWPQDMGFGSCCVFDRYTYAGAATVIGPDNLAYHHLFVR